MFFLSTDKTIKVESSRKCGVDFVKLSDPKRFHSHFCRMEFKTTDFINETEQDLTPIGLSWFQTQWDESVSETAKALGMLKASF